MCAQNQGKIHYIHILLIGSFQLRKRPSSRSSRWGPSFGFFFLNGNSRVVHAERLEERPLAVLVVPEEDVVPVHDGAVLRPAARPGDAVVRLGRVGAVAPVGVHDEVARADVPLPGALRGEVVGRDPELEPGDAGQLGADEVVLRPGADGGQDGGAVGARVQAVVAGGEPVHDVALHFIDTNFEAFL